VSAYTSQKRSRLISLNTYRVEVRGRKAGKAHPLHGRDEPPDIAPRCRALPRQRRRVQTELPRTRAGRSVYIRRPTTYLGRRCTGPGGHLTERGEEQSAVGERGPELVIGRARRGQREPRAREKRAQPRDRLRSPPPPLRCEEETQKRDEPAVSVARVVGARICARKDREQSERGFTGFGAAVHGGGGGGGHRRIERPTRRSLPPASEVEVGIRITAGWFDPRGERRKEGAERNVDDVRGRGWWSRNGTSGRRRASACALNSVVLFYLGHGWCRGVGDWETLLVSFCFRAPFFCSVYKSVPFCRLF
jgi:hypothetical protein